MTDPGTLGAALNDAITQIIAGLPEPTPPKAPTWEDVRRMWEKHRPPYVLACPPGRHADVRDAVGVAGMGHLVEVCATDMLNITRGPYAPLIVSARVARELAPNLQAGDFTAECTVMCPVKIYP